MKKEMPLERRVATAVARQLIKEWAVEFGDWTTGALASHFEPTIHRILDRELTTRYQHSSRMLKLFRKELNKAIVHGGLAGSL